MSIEKPLAHAAGILTIVATVLVATYQSGETWPWLWLGIECALTAFMLMVEIRARRRDASYGDVAMAMMFTASIVWYAVFSAAMVALVRHGDASLAVLAAATAVGFGGIAALRAAPTPRYAILVLAICYAPIGFELAVFGQPHFKAIALLVPLWMAGLAALIIQTYRGTVRMIRAELQVRRAALTDHLTGLPNRTFVEQELDVLCGRLDRGERFAVLCLDLDGFKQVNDVHGHAAGDMLLRSFAGRLSHAIRNRDSASRIGGDEFVVLLPGAGATEAAFIARRIIAAIGRPFDIGQPHQVRVGVSIGGAMAPEAGTSPVEILSAGDKALYAAKRAGKGTYRLFQPEPIWEPAAVSA